MFDSIHTARWLSQFKDQNLEFLLVPSSPHRRLNSQLSNLVASSGKAKFKFATASKIFGLPLWVLDKFFDNGFRGLWVRSLTKTFKPDSVHALELQNAGYIALKAFEKKKPAEVKLISTNWGSDIFWFQQFPKHREKLSKLLSISDRYSCECHRDVELAKELGFKGEVLPVAPNAGGFTKEILNQPLVPLANRNVIAIKGYHGWVGRAKVALQALEMIATEISKYSVVVYSANATTVRFAKKVARRTSLKIQVHGKGKLSHSQVLDLFSQAKVYVGLSLSDGISTSLLEAMAMGAIPVQTSTACCDEWFSDTGVAISEISSSRVAEAIIRGLELASNQSNADRNKAVIIEKADSQKISQASLRFYDL